MIKSAEQGLTSCEDGLIITAGNTTSQTGLLYEVAVRGRSQLDADGKPIWEVVSITADPDDPKRTPRVPVEWARQQIELYGRENPWVMAYVLGLFPPGSIDALLSADDVEKAMNIHPGLSSTPGRRSGSASTSRDSATTGRCFSRGRGWPRSLPGHAPRARLGRLGAHRRRRDGEEDRVAREGSNLRRGRDPPRSSMTRWAGLTAPST